MQLNSRADRDAANIDTYERAFAWSTFLMRSVNTATRTNNRYLNSIRIAYNLYGGSTDGKISQLNIEAKIPYSDTAIKAGGNFIENLKEFTTVLPDYSLITCPPTSNNEAPLSDEPSYVTTLERYFGWSTLNLTYGYLNLNNSIPPIKMNFSDEDAIEPYLQVNASLKFNTQKYLETNNVVTAIMSEIKTSLDADNSSYIYTGVI